MQPGQGSSCSGKFTGYYRSWISGKPWLRPQQGCRSQRPLRGSQWNNQKKWRKQYASQRTPHRSTPGFPGQDQPKAWNPKTIARRPAIPGTFYMHLNLPLPSILDKGPRSDVRWQGVAQISHLGSALSPYSLMVERYQYLPRSQKIIHLWLQGWSPFPLVKHVLALSRFLHVLCFLLPEHKCSRTFLTGRPQLLGCRILHNKVAHLILIDFLFTSFTA